MVVDRPAASCPPITWKRWRPETASLIRRHGEIPCLALVVASGSAIGRGAMILLAALAASFCPALYAQIRMEIMDSLRRRRRDGQRLSRP
jgi:hypothetical protein